MNIFRKQSVN